MQDRDHCFMVELAIRGSAQLVDAKNRFCARMRPAYWTLKENSGLTFTRPQHDRRPTDRPQTIDRGSEVPTGNAGDFVSCMI
jgi:hypothetical protein